LKLPFKNNKVLKFPFKKTKVLKLKVRHDPKNNNPSMVQEHPSRLDQLKLELKDFVPKGEEALKYYTL